MTNKTPYEIRLDVLKMAQEMLDTEMRLKEQSFLQAVETLRTTDIGGVNSYVETNAPTMYSSEEVISKASSLYNFVSRDKPSTVSDATHTISTYPAGSPPRPTRK